MNNSKSFFYSSAIFVIFLLLITPLIILIFQSFTPIDTGTQKFLIDILHKYIFNSLVLLVFVVFFTLLIGVTSAWMVTIYDFPLKEIISYLLLLPLAVPAYIASFVYTDILEFAGPLQSSIRNHFDLYKGEYYFPQIRSLGGAIFIMTFVFYPYVYIVCKIAFEKSNCLLDVSKVMGKNYFNIFIKIAIPSIRPAIIAGSSLVAMETLADFGAVKYLDIQTFTTGIYRSWYLSNDFSTSSKLSLILLIFVLCVLMIEKFFRKNKTYTLINNTQKNIKAVKIEGNKKYLITILCITPFLVGFLIPVIRLLMFSLESNFDSRSFEYLNNSLKVSILASFVALFIAIIFSYYNRNYGKHIITKLSCIGYAVPGSVLAIGVLIMFTGADHIINGISQTLFDKTVGLIFSGSIFALIFAYVFRFLAVSFNNVDSSMIKIRKEIDLSAYLLGKNKNFILRNIHIPLIKSSSIIAFLLVFVESMKELPATLIIRPFNFETLATATYQLASDERLRDSANTSLIMIFISLCAILALSKQIKNK